MGFSKCSWPRLEQLVNNLVGGPLIKIYNGARGGANSQVGRALLHYLPPHGDSYYDLIINAHSVNDQHVLIMIEAGLYNTSLAGYQLAMAENFTRAVMASEENTILIWLEDYLGNEQRSILDLQDYFSKTIHLLSNYYGFGVGPINEDGNLVLGHHNDWIQTRMQKETTRTNHVAVVVPGPNDVLMGRGKIFKENPGTLRLKRIVLQQEDRYNNGSKFEKTVVIHSILRMIQDHGGRFLKKTPEGWIELSQDKAHDKISHSFRNKRKSHQRKPLTLWSTSRIY